MEKIHEFEPFFGEWYSEGLIGAGSAGMVYRIYKDTNGTRTRAALKHIPIPARESDTERLRSDGISDEAIGVFYSDAARSVEEGISLLSSLKDDDHIVRIEESVILPRTDGVGFDAFIRMELLTGLEELTAEGPLPTDEIVRLGTDICSAVEHLRQRGVIHREIKPGNILRSRMGDYKLGDFGLFRVLVDPDSADVERAYGYLAPEVINGEKYGSLCDQYSLGTVMYTLLNGGHLPFMSEGRDSEADLERALKLRFGGEELPAPRNADDQLSWIVLRACSFDPEGRFPNAGEMRKALLRYARGEEVAPAGWHAPRGAELPELGGEAVRSLCPCCGEALEDGAEFCPRCGRLLDPEDTEGAAPEEPAAEPEKPKKPQRVRPRTVRRRGRTPVAAIIAAICALLLIGGAVWFIISRVNSGRGQTASTNTPEPTVSSTDAAETAEPTAIRMRRASPSAARQRLRPTRRRPLRPPSSPTSPRRLPRPLRRLRPRRRPRPLLRRRLHPLRLLHRLRLLRRLPLPRRIPTIGSTPSVTALSRRPSEGRRG